MQNSRALHSTPSAPLESAQWVYGEPMKFIIISTSIRPVNHYGLAYPIGLISLHVSLVCYGKLPKWPEVVFAIGLRFTHR